MGDSSNCSVLVLSEISSAALTRLSYTWRDKKSRRRRVESIEEDCSGILFCSVAKTTTIIWCSIH